MGWHMKGKGWFKGSNHKKSWGEKSWKKKSNKNCERDDRDDRKECFDKKAWKFDWDTDLKITKSDWKFKGNDDCSGWKGKFNFKDCGIDLKIKPWVKEWKHKQDRGDDCDRGQIKIKDCKFDWGNCKIDPPTECGPEIVETVCDYPEPPVDKENTAPTIVAPTVSTIAIGDFSENQMVTKVVAEDLDNDALIFQINDSSDADSPDADQFVINSETGEITLIGDPSLFGSADGDGSYQIEVEVTDGQATDSIILDFNYYVAA